MQGKRMYVENLNSWEFLKIENVESDQSGFER